MVHSNEVALSVNEDVDWLEAVVQGDSIVVNTKAMKQVKCVLLMYIVLLVHEKTLSL